MNIAEFAISKIGQGYIYGAKGQICSPIFRSRQAQQYPEQAQNILNTGAKWDGIPVWDCAQLTRYAAEAAGHALPSGATSQWEKGAWAEKGALEKMDKTKPAFVYRREDGRMQHTGIYMGDGTVIHAKGTKWGVVQEKLADCTFTHYALLGKGMEDEMETMQAVIISGDGNPVKLRADPSRNNPYVDKLAAGTTVRLLGETVSGNEKWQKVDAGGQVGYVMSCYLAAPAEQDEAKKDETVVTLALPRGAAQQLLKALESAL